MGFLNDVQNFSENLWQQGADTATSETGECDKAIAELDRKSEALITEIGQLYVRNNTVESSSGTPFEEPMKALKETAERKEALFKKKLALQGQRMCENCGNVLSIDSLFCNKCGEKLEPIQAAGTQNTASGGFCPKCGAELEEGSVFCIKCGNKI